MIPRFYDPSSGSVKIDDVDIRNFRMKSLRKHISFVLQETALFNAPIWQNIAYGKPGSSREEIVRAARLANAHDFIMRTPRGYETMVGERGVSLSGGQQQRVAIARAIIREAPILILDEPSRGLNAIGASVGHGGVIAFDSHTSIAELMPHDGRLTSVAGLGNKRVAGVRDSLASRLGRVRRRRSDVDIEQPSVAELLDVDREYREGAAQGSLPRIAPRRFNPLREAWLPILHTARGTRHYTAVFSNTARAHQLGRTRDWVVIYYDGGSGERQCTVITAQRGPLEGERIVRGREAECEAHYHPDAPRR